MKSGRARAVGIGTLLLGILLLSGMAIAQSSYGANVIQSKSSTVTVSSGGSATVDNTGSTGVSATISGLTGVSSAVVTTQSLSGPSSGVTSFSTSGTYFDLSVTLPAGTTVPPGATVTVCFTNSGVASGDTLNYYHGGTWTAATNVSITGNQICGSVPLSALTGTNFVVAPAAAADYTLYYVGGFIVVIIVIAILVMRRPKRS